MSKRRASSPKLQSHQSKTSKEDNSDLVSALFGVKQSPNDGTVKSSSGPPRILSLNILEDEIVSTPEGSVSVPPSKRASLHPELQSNQSKTSKTDKFDFFGVEEFALNDETDHNSPRPTNRLSPNIPAKQIASACASSVSVSSLKGASSEEPQSSQSKTSKTHDSDRGSPLVGVKKSANDRTVNGSLRPTSRPPPDIFENQTASTSDGKVSVPLLKRASSQEPLSLQLRTSQTDDSDLVSALFGVKQCVNDGNINIPPRPTDRNSLNVFENNLIVSASTGSMSVPSLNKASLQELQALQSKSSITEEPDLVSASAGGVSASTSEGINASAEKIVQRKSSQDLKKELFSLLLLFSENCGDFSTGGVLSYDELECFPNIEISEFGILPLPLNRLTFDCIKPLCSQSPYGSGEETLVDVTVRNSFQLEPKKFEIKNEKFVDQISILVENKIKPSLGLKRVDIYAKIYKLLFYEPGGKFDEHRDTEKEDNMFGTLIIQLPSVFTGGDLIVKHCNSSRIFKNSTPETGSHCSYVAHYASCPHELKEVTSGYRAAIIYSLCWQGNGLRPSPYRASTNTVKLCNMMNEYMERADILHWALEYEYSLSSIQSGALDFFKGSDKNTISALKNAFEYDKVQYGKDRWELYIATAHKKVTEYGNCYGHGGYARRWGGCSSDDGCCFEYDWEESNGINLTDFISLTSKSEKNDLEFTFDPKEVINFSDEYEEFWGDDKGTGCSGPTGNEGAHRERWYQKKVLLFWRKDKSLTLKINSSLSDGVSHVLTLLRAGELVEGKQGFELLWKSLENLSSDSSNIIQLLEITTILKLGKEACHLLKIMHKWGYQLITLPMSSLLLHVALKAMKKSSHRLKNFFRKVTKVRPDEFFNAVAR